MKYSIDTKKSILDFLNEVSEAEGYTSWNHCCRIITVNDKNIDDRNIIPQIASKLHAASQLAQYKAVLIMELEARELELKRDSTLDMSSLTGRLREIKIFKNLIQNS